MITSMNQELYIPVILGTVRQGRQSENAARFVKGEVEKREGVRTELIDIRELPLPVNDAGEPTKDSGFSQKMQEADGLILVVPEYNHGYPGLFKHVMDSCLKEYIHKAAGIVGVSKGPFGGSRVIEALLPVLRELGLVTIFNDVNFGSIGKVFDTSGKLIDQAFVRRTDRFLEELIWMAKALCDARENNS